MINKSTVLNSEVIPYDELKKSMLTTLRVGTFGRVVSFNADRGTVNVQPLIKERISTQNGIIEVDMPLMLNCPVFFSGGTTFTPQVNSLCVLIHMDRSFQELINNYDLNNGETIKTYGQGNSTRKHDLSDAIALVGFLSYKQASEVTFE